MSPMENKKILKTMGYCCEGCGWFFCDFYECKPIMSETVIDEEQIITGHEHICNLFNVLITKGSLKICNHVYGMDYEGSP